METPLDITRIDPFDGEAMDAWWDQYAAALRTDLGPDAMLWSREENRAKKQQRTGHVERRVYLARRDGVVVGSGSLALPLTDNRHSATLLVSVAASHRRHGVGSALLATMEAEAAAAGRTTLRSETSWSTSTEARPALDTLTEDDGAGAPGREFARAHGYAIALGDKESSLSLPVADARIDSLLIAARTASAGYETRSFVGPVPDAYAAEWAYLDGILGTEAPTGDLDVQTAQRGLSELRESEALLRDQGRTTLGTIARNADGHVVAYTQIVLSRDDGNAYQWGTLVRREDRGHRLGLRVKLENLRLLQRHAPEIPRIVTYNAVLNGPMLAVNALLGFEETARMAELQKRLP